MVIQPGLTVFFINPDSSCGTTYLPAETKARVTEMQRLVGGFFQILPIKGTPNVTLYVNEEGNLLDLPRNRLAERVAVSFGFSGRLVGSMLIMGPDSGLTATQVTMLCGRATRVLGEMEDEDVEEP